MKRQEIRRLDAELERFLDTLTEGMGRPERERAMRLYVTGLLLDGSRKSMQPMAARLAETPAKADAVRQRLDQCISSSRWADEVVRKRLAGLVERQMPNIEAFVIDDTGFPKKGTHSVGVGRQYSGTLGRT